MVNHNAPAGAPKTVLPQATMVENVEKMEKSAKMMVKPDAWHQPLNACTSIVDNG